VHGDVETMRRQLQGDAPADSAGGTGHQTNRAWLHAFYNPAMPSIQSRSVSAPLVRLIHEAIAGQGDWLPFDRFMALALYAPGLGYYATPGAKFGTLPAGGSDFVTAPELSPLFGRTLARAVRQAMTAGGCDEVWEFGAGSGALAEQLLDALGDSVARYCIVELSGVLRERQARQLARFEPKVCWLDALPQRICAVIVANEVLDAMPVQLLHYDGAVWRERGVTRDGEGFAWSDRATSLSAPFEQGLVPGTTTEIHAQAMAFIATLAQRLERGSGFFIDYGFPQSEYYHPDRRGGTLMCHRAHLCDDNPLLDVGRKDITAHVDFTGVALAGQANGMSVLGYTSQARFLMNCGLLEFFATATVRERAHAQKLVNEHEMGELFKVIGFSKGCEYDSIGFTLGDRTHTL
jgi:SAM-dependent MidA family methyltransferase